MMNSTISGRDTMDNNAKWVNDMKIERVMKNLQANNMQAHYVKNQEELLATVKSLMSEGETVSVGGSATLFETGVIDFLRNGKYDFLDRHVELTPEERKALYRNCFSADTYITSTNAITENGELYNVDGSGNRVAAMIYGPDQVIVITGVNKIVKDEAAAIDRYRRIAAPANAKRLNRNTPCAKLGYCTQCDSPEHICSAHVMIRRQFNSDRIKVIIIDGNYGY